MYVVTVYWKDGHESFNMAVDDYTMWLLKTDKDVKCICSAETGEIIYMNEK